MQLKSLLAAALLALISIAASAQTAPPPPANGAPRSNQAGQGPGGPHRGPPPPEALAACQGHAPGAVCNFNDREGKALSGTCFSPQADRPLACRPARAGGQQGVQAK